MLITGPFLDRKARRRGAPAPWYLRVKLPKVDASGATVRDAEGAIVMRRWRPYYESKGKAAGDIDRIRGEHGAVGTGTFSFDRGAAAEYETAKRIAPEARLDDLARFWRKHHPIGVVRTIDELVPKFIAIVEKRAGSTAHPKDLKTRVGIFARTFGKRIPNTVTRREIMDYLFAYPESGRTVLNLKQGICSFFNWLLEQDPPLVETNPAGRIKKRQLPQFVSAPIKFLKLEEAEAYLRAAERYDPELVPHEVVQLLAGVRADDEMADFDGAWVHASTREVEVPADIAKKAQREVINTLEDNFWDWWKAYGREGILRPINYLNRWTRLRTLAHVALHQGQAQADELAALPIKTLLKRPEAKAAVKAWPWNGRRRTFATYHVAKYQSADRTASILRHRGDTYTLHNSYRGRGVTQAAGVTYFSWKPKKAKRPILPAVVAPRGIVRLRFEQRRAAAASAASA